MDSSKAVLTTKKGNISFREADLATIVLLSVPILWQNQYNLNHSTVPESTHSLLPELDAIEQVMVEKQGTKLKAKGKSGTAPSKTKGNLKPKASGLGAQLVESLRRFAMRSSASVAKHMVIPSRPTTPWTAVATIATVSPSRQQQVSPLSPRSPTRSLGGIRA
jgi:hypothetical protein